MRPQRRATDLATRLAGGAATLLLLLVTAVVVPAPAATAVTTAGWGAWDPLAGSAGAFTTTVRLPARGFPAATVTSDSRGGQVGVQTGSTTWLSPATPPGAVFGSSQGQGYLNLRPRADNQTSPSTTTYTFERPTPAGGWAFVLGDIDADRAVVVARGADGQLVTGAQLGWQGGFNYCAVSPRPSCTGTADDVATWDPVTGEVLGNAAGLDTSGAAGWFRPTVPLTSLTVYFFQRSGFPVYQTWFASLARDVTGTARLQDPDDPAVTGPVAGATLTLFGPDGTVLATTTSGADGAYAFPGYAAAAGYTVEVIAPPAPTTDHPGYVVEGPARLPADLSTSDATLVDFLVREIVPVPVSGFVRTADGAPVPGAVVTLDGPGGPRTATTDSTGAYLLDDVPVGTHTFSVVPPPGYTVSTSPEAVEVPAGSEVPITDQDFVVQAPAAVSGTVTAGGAGVPGAVVTVSGPGGTFTVPTAADGTYTVEGIAPGGEWTVSVEVPFGYTADGPTTQTVTVTADDVTGVDFQVQRPGSVGGTVLDAAGTPVAGVTVIVSGPGGDVTLTTSTDGVYATGALPAGAYTVTLTVPDGYTAGVTERSTTITAAGENRLDQDFVITPVPSAQPVGGTVSDDADDPVPGATVTVRDAAGDVVGTATSGDDGAWSVDLPPGTGYTAEVAPPDGYALDGESNVTFDVTDGPVTDLDFTLVATGTATPGPSPSPDPTGLSSAPGTAGGRGLAATGVDAGAALVAAGLLVIAGTGAIGARRRRSRA
ncbi:collagen binding domain-containing protein [Cellulosimicrobium sp. SH8]|uniref:MSCRAMM family protein n=1 Tax=Cellulosimicrobium sp. SH8 TaxID=2952936 RepID=UPI0021F2D022|nr:carboxypeptidase regulatory-like domain-containing protein [Cellulosimicrobium sp. SH8]